MSFMSILVLLFVVSIFFFSTSSFFNYFDARRLIFCFLTFSTTILYRYLYFSTLLPASITFLSSSLSVKSRDCMS